MRVRPLNRPNHDTRPVGTPEDYNLAIATQQLLWYSTLELRRVVRMSAETVAMMTAVFRGSFPSPPPHPVGTVTGDVLQDDVIVALFPAGAQDTLPLLQSIQTEYGAHTSFIQRYSADEAAGA